MYEVDQLDKVSKIPDIPEPTCGAPCPIVASDEHKVLVTYYSSHFAGTNERPAAVTSAADGQIVIVRFDAFAHFFGPPNDEAFSGHPLASRGLHCYSVSEVTNSSWIRKLERMNSVHPSHDRNWFLKGKRHFIISFHDSTFECIARKYRVETFQGSIDSAIDQMIRALYDSR
jgi:hypothetical protein